MAHEYTQHDRDMATSVVLRLNNGGGGPGTQVKFQFPPKINSDGRKATWKEAELRGDAQFAAFATSGPREITLQWCYIIDGGQWSIATVTEQVRLIRGYFAQIKEGDSDRQALAVYFKMWDHGGSKPWTFRIKSIDVKHSDTYIFSRNGDAGGNVSAYPLRTDISLELRLWATGSVDKEKGIQNVGGILNNPRPQDNWY